MIEIIRKIWPSIIAICAFIVGAIGLYASGKKRGANEERAANIEESLKNGIETKKHISNMSDDDVDNILYKNARD